MCVSLLFCFFSEPWHWSPFSRNTCATSAYHFADIEKTEAASELHFEFLLCFRYDRRSHYVSGYCSCEGIYNCPVTQLPLFRFKAVSCRNLVKCFKEAEFSKQGFVQRVGQINTKTRTNVFCFEKNIRIFYFTLTTLLSWITIIGSLAVRTQRQVSSLVARTAPLLSSTRILCSVFCHPRNRMTRGHR